MLGTGVFIDERFVERLGVVTLAEPCEGLSAFENCDIFDIGAVEILQKLPELQDRISILTLVVLDPPDVVVGLGHV